MSSTKLNLATVIDQAAKRLARSLRVSMPGRIESYDSSTQRATVKPLISEPFTDEEGDRELYEFPVITDVPVMHPNAGGYRIHLPVTAGDLCQLVFSDFSLDVFLQQGGGPVDPGDDRSHDLADAVAYMGGQPTPNALTVPDGEMSMGANDGPQINISGTEVKIGEGNDVRLATIADVENIRAWLITHTHPSHGTPSGLAAPVVTGTSILRGE